VHVFKGTVTTTLEHLWKCRGRHRLELLENEGSSETGALQEEEGIDNKIWIPNVC
jgi:hypothetical protein